MNRPTLISLAAGLAGAACVAFFMTVTTAATNAALHGRYLDARNAAVFAGACHFNGELASQGDRALIAWQIEGGRWQDVELGGLSVVCALRADDNLITEAPRSTEVYLSADCSPEQERAALDWLRTRHGDALGTIVGVERATIALEFDGDDYVVRVPERVTLEGVAMADRACCTMRENVWYEPLVTVQQPIVGMSSTLRFEGSEALDAWAYQGQNQTFIASFNECCWEMRRAEKCCTGSDSMRLAAR